MEIKITISLDEKTTDVLEKLIGRLPGAPRVTAVDEIAPDGVKQPSKARNGLTDKVPEPKPKKASPQKPAGQSASEAGKPKKQISDEGDEVIELEDLRSMMVEVRESCGLEKTKEILRTFNAKKLSDIPEDRYGALKAAMAEVL